MNERMPWDDDELSEDDLAFLSEWENAGHDSDEHEALEIVEAEGHGNAEVVAAESDQKFEGESDLSLSGESDEIDESKMDISQVEDGSEDYDDPGSGEEGDDEPSDDELGDYSDADDDELDSESDSEPDHLGNDSEEPDEIPEGEDDLDYDPDLEYEDGEDDQVEEEFGDGERADTDSEIEDLDEYEKEREEKKEQELNADAEDDFEGDAQQELEDHLNQEQDEPDNDAPEDHDEEPEDEATPEDFHGDDDTQSEADEKSEPEPLVEQPDENQDEGEEQHSGKFENLPEAGDLCTNHCEDNEPDESLEETCPHCMERIRNERELHGAIATDMHGKDVLPGDKLRVRIPIGMIAKDSIVTANVPNMEVEPERLAVTTVGKRDKERCWLSGKGVSNFTGWRMTDVGNSIWTFKKGHVISFAEKIAQPLFDELDPEKMFEQLSDELDNYGKEENDERPENDPEPESDSEGSEDEPEGESESDDEPEDIEEHREKRNREELSAAQRKRFENLTARNWKKILNTFGSTVEAERLMDIVENGNQLRRGGSVVSRGVLYTFGFVAGKASDDVIEEIQQWHKDREQDDAA